MPSVIVELSAGIKISRILARTVVMREGERRGRGQRLGRAGREEEREDEKERNGLAAAVAEENVAKGSAIDERSRERGMRMRKRRGVGIE